MSSTRPTIRDVARLAGVSHQTVSRVINGSTDVIDDTRIRVEEAIAQLGYRPSAIARSMARGRSYTLACIAPNMTDFTFSSIIDGAEREARKRGYLFLSSSASDGESFKELVDRLVGEAQVDGLLILNPFIDARSQYIPQNLPVVFIGAKPKEFHVSTVCLDDTRAGHDATAHLAQLGYKNIAMVTGPMIEDCSRDRLNGYNQALSEYQLPTNPAMVYEGDWSATSGQAAMMMFVKSGHMPDAIFAQNDRMAIGVLHAARDMGLKVPKQLGVIGIDDMPLSSYFDPPLTTMRQDMSRIGQEAASLLVGSVEDSNAALLQVRLSAELIVRKSTQERG
jgi:DNA-binding LacI/PurR family transcriptional regulator